MNLVKCIKIEYLCGNETFVSLGIHGAFMAADRDGQTFVMSYVLDDKCTMQHQWALTPEGIKEAIWEWLCSLSRSINDGHRLMGSWKNVEAA